MKSITKEVLKQKLSRRQFLNKSSQAGVCAAASLAIPMPFASHANVNPTEEDVQTKYSACLVNCGSRCPLKCTVKNNVITQIESENGIDESVFGQHQIRPCLRGRSNKYRTYSPDRLKYPMLRVGKRGDGRFKRISWDEATTLIADNIKKNINKYGNESIYLNLGTGASGNIHGRTALRRMFSSAGGYLNYHNTYSDAQISQSQHYVYGNGVATALGSPLTQIRNSDLVVLFGHNLAETRMSGGGEIKGMLDALAKSDAKVIIIDPRKTDSSIAYNAEWLPIRPGTDGALVAALVHEMLRAELIDESEIDRYAVGFSEASLPEGAPRHSSYKSYVLGLAEDGIEKTPAWAAGLTRIPEVRIKALAHEIVKARACWIGQGWGIQRTSNGEQASRAILTLPVIAGQFGRPGTNLGGWGASVSHPVKGFGIKNPVTASIPCFLWERALNDATSMTATNSYVKGVDRLTVPIKMMINYASNIPMNQHANLNKAKKTLADESKCEFIVTWDNMMTSTAKYSDLILPDVTWIEAQDIVNNSYATGMYTYLIRMDGVVEPLWENRHQYDVLSEIAYKVSKEVGDKFTEGRTRQEWLDYIYQETRKEFTDLPPLEKSHHIGVLRRELHDDEDYIGLSDFRADPEAHPIATPSGKVEIYSAALAELNNTWELPEGDSIPAIPSYTPSRRGLGAPQTERNTYPLQLTGFHTKSHTHSTYANVVEVQSVAPGTVWINPVDAEKRGIRHHDPVIVHNDNGQLLSKAKVTSRVMPGVLAMGQGAWHNANASGLDVGGCLNVLTSDHPSPLAKGNPQHSNLVDIKKA